MPVLIDGYNLYYYVKAIYAEERQLLSLSSFCRLIAEWAKRSRNKVTIVFDGRGSSELPADQKRYGALLIEFSGDISADQLIERKIETSTAPKSLIIVTDDRSIIKAARRRRCKIVKTAEFWWGIAKVLTSSARSRRKEPPEKRRGLLSRPEIDYWIRYFGLEEGEL